jgi:hypothetical protein
VETRKERQEKKRLSKRTGELLANMVVYEGLTKERKAPGRL